MSLLPLCPYLLLICLLSIPCPGTHGLKFSHFPLTHGRSDTVQQPKNARPTGRPDVSSGVGVQARHQEALKALLSSGEFDLGDEVTSDQGDRGSKGSSQNSDDRIRSRTLDRKVKTSDSGDQRRNKDKQVKSGHREKIIKNGEARESSRKKPVQVRSRNRDAQQISITRNRQQISKARDVEQISRNKNIQERSKNVDDQSLPRRKNNSQIQNTNDQQISKTRDIQQTSRNIQQKLKNEDDRRMPGRKNHSQIQRGSDDEQIYKAREIQQISRNIQQKSKNYDLKIPQRNNNSQIARSGDDQKISIQRDFHENNLQKPRHRDDQQTPRTRQEQTRLRKKNDNVRSRNRGGNVSIGNLRVQQPSTNRDKKNQLRGGSDQTRQRSSIEPRKINSDDGSNSRNTQIQPRLKASSRIPSRGRKIVEAVASQGRAEQGSHTLIGTPQARVRQSINGRARDEQGQHSTINHQEANIKLISEDNDGDSNSSNTGQRVNKGRGRNIRPQNPSSETKNMEANKLDGNFRTQLPRRQNLEVLGDSFKPKEKSKDVLSDRKIARNKIRIKVSDTVSPYGNNEKGKLSSVKSVTNSYQTSNDQSAPRSRNISYRDPALSFLGRDKTETSTQQTGLVGIIEKSRTGIRNQDSVKLNQDKQLENRVDSDNNQPTRESTNEKKRKQNKENTEFQDIQTLDSERKRPITSRTKPNVEKIDIEEDYIEFQSINKERQDIDTKQSDVDVNFRSDYEFKFEENIDEVESEERNEVNHVKIVNKPQYSTDKPLLKVLNKIQENTNDRIIGHVESANRELKPIKLNVGKEAQFANTQDSGQIIDTNDTQKTKVTNDTREDAVLSYDLKKALKHAELTWAADPFRKQVPLPGQAPVFDIDYSKNTAQRGEAASPTTDNYKEEYRRPEGDTHSVTAVRQDFRRNDPSIDTLAAEDDKLDNIKLIPIEALTWTPALVKEKAGSIEVDSRQPKHGQF